MERPQPEARTNDLDVGAGWLSRLDEHTCRITGFGELSCEDGAAETRRFAHQVCRFLCTSETAVFARVLEIDNPRPSRAAG